MSLHDFHTRTTLSTIVLSLAIAGLSGCTLFAPAGPTMDEIETAYQAKNTKKLKEWCDEGKKWPDDTSAARQGKQACIRLKRLNKKQEGEKQLEAYKANLTCDGAIEQFEKYKESGPTQNRRIEAYYAAGKKLGECGRYDVLFEKHLSRKVNPVSSDPTKRHPYGVLKALAEDGAAVKDEIVNFAGQSNFQFDGAQRTVEAIFTFLEQNDITGNCDAYLGIMKSKNAAAMKHAMEYFSMTQCKAAGPAVAETLKNSEISWLREDACQTLGKIGDPAHSEIVELVAKNDPKVVIEDETKVYPVRDACSGALVKLKSN